MTIPYLKISMRTNSRERLAILRVHGMSRGSDWRGARLCNFRTLSAPLCAGYNTENAGTAYERRRPIWSNFSGPQFREEAMIHCVSELHISHRGWYSDADNNATICGIVARLPHDRWIAGYYSSDNGERVYLSQVFKSLEEAANEADDEARRVAEEEKEHHERYCEAQVLDDKITKLESDVRELFPMRRYARGRREIKEVIPQLRALREERADDYSDIEA